MAERKRQSLKKLLFIHEIAFLFLVAVTGALGGLSAFFWQETSSESVRINNLIYVTEQIRSELFRQIQQVIRARMLEDTRALSVYAVYSQRIDKLFNELRRVSNTRGEAELIQALQLSYRTIQNDMNAIFSDPYAANNAARMKILDPRFSERLVGVFEGRYLYFKSTLVEKHTELDKTIERWTRFAPILIPVFFILAVMLVLFTRRFLIHGFVRPMATVMQGAAIIRQGNLQHRIPEQGIEEVAEIGDSLNTMASELSSSRDALVESERQAVLGALIPVVAHNIRNPLASIRATAQLLDDVEDSEELKESKQAIMDTIDRLGRWVSALVSYLHPL
ncbi:MAG: methyl-accepting chemotaxis protein, partial [Planctomycetota bacterium]